MSRAEARRTAAEMLAATGLGTIGGRTADEIADRYDRKGGARRRHRRAAGTAPHPIPRRLGPVAGGVKELRALRSAGTGSTSTKALDGFEARLDAFAARGIDLDRLAFAADFGRRLDYYTGFVFEIHASRRRGARPIVGGGRYDRLVALIGDGGAVPGGRLRHLARPDRSRPMTAPLVIAIPSKGRLQASTAELFARAGLDVLQQGAERSYRGAIAGLGGVEVAFLSAPEIAREIGAGAVHLGITGRDQVEETVPDFADRTGMLAARSASAIARWSSRCRRRGSTSSPWRISTTSPPDFRPRHGRRLTVATKYINVTRRFFAGHGIADYRIVESLGATEGAPASGAADLIVDITSTGATLRANGLKVLADGVILRSEAHLVASRAAEWDGGQRRALRPDCLVGSRPPWVRADREPQRAPISASLQTSMLAFALAAISAGGLARCGRVARRSPSARSTT